LKNYSLKTMKIKSIKSIGVKKAHNLYVEKNNNFILGNNIVTHNTEQSFHSMRSMIEKYSDQARFIFTCNYISKIPLAVDSRFQTYIFKQMPVNFVNDYCKKVLDSEKIKYDEKDLKFIIDNLYPDIRKIVGTLQRHSVTGTLKVNRNEMISIERTLISSIVEIVNFCQNGEDHKINSIVSNIVNLLSKSDVDYRNIYNDLFFKTDVPTHVKILVNKYTGLQQDHLLPSMNFMALVFEIVEVLKKYRQLTGKK